MNSETKAVVLAFLIPAFCSAVMRCTDRTNNSLSAWLSHIDAPAVFAHDHHETGYVPWGTDEFELFGMTKSELEKKFKDLEFEKNSDTVYLSRGNSGPQFLLTYTDKKVSKIQRMFLDGAGCRIMGPVLNSKKEAAQFSVDGLLDLPNIQSRPKEYAKLVQAKQVLGLK